MNTYLVVASFGGLYPVGFQTGTTHAESYLMALACPRYGIRDPIDSVQEIPELEVESLNGVSLISNIWFILPQDEPFADRPENLIDTGVKIRHEKRRLNHFDHDPKYEKDVAKAMGKFFGKKMVLGGNTYRYKAYTDNTLNSYPRVLLSGFGFLVACKTPAGIQAIQQLLEGSSFGKQFSARISSVHAVQTDDVNPIYTEDQRARYPLRPFTEQQADACGITHALSFWMGTGVNRKHSKKGWVFDGLVRPFVIGDIGEEDFPQFMINVMREPAELPQRFSLPYTNEAALAQVSNHVIAPTFKIFKGDDAKFGMGVCGVTQKIGRVQIRPNPSSLSHGMIGRFDSQEVAVFRSSEVQEVLKIGHTGTGPLMTVSQNGHAEVSVYVNPKNLIPKEEIKKKIKAGVSYQQTEGKFKASDLKEQLSKTTPRVVLNVSSNKIDRVLDDVRWSAGAILYDNSIRDYVDKKVVDDFEGLTKPVQIEVEQRLRHFTKNLNYTIEGTEFLRLHLTRITPVHMEIFKGMVK